MTTYNPALQHMEVSGTDWQQWRARIWNQIADTCHGYPGLDPLEQWMRRSKKGKCCIECGEPGTVKQDSVIVAAVDHYYLCQPCDEYYKEKHR